MGSPLWTKEEREYFIKEIMPLSQYATGTFTSGKPSFGELAPIMQAELDRRGVSRRKYTAKNLFQHYYQRFGSLGSWKKKKVGDEESLGNSGAGDTMSRFPSALGNDAAKTFQTISFERSHTERAFPGQIFYSDACTQTEIQPDSVRTVHVPSKRRRTLDTGSPSPAGASLDWQDSHAHMRGSSAVRRQLPDLSIPPPRMNSLENIRFSGPSSSAKSKGHHLSLSIDRSEAVCKSKGPAMSTFRIHSCCTIEAEPQRAPGSFDPFSNALPKKDSVKSVLQTASRLPDPFVPIISNSVVDSTITIRPAPTTRAPIDRLLDHFSNPSALDDLPDSDPTAKAGDCLKTMEGMDGASDIDSLSPVSRRNRVQQIVNSKINKNGDSN